MSARGGNPDDRLARRRERADLLTVYCMRAGLAVLSLTAAVLLCAKLLLDGIPAELASGSTRLRNFLEVLYFLSSTVLPVIAVFALVVAWNQVSHAREQNRHAREQNRIAERASRGASYIILFEKIIGSFAKIQPVILSLPASYRAARETGVVGKEVSEGAYIASVITSWGDQAAELSQRNTVKDFLNDLENLALLVRRQYISCDDIYYLLEGPPPGRPPGFRHLYPGEERRVARSTAL